MIISHKHSDTKILVPHIYFWKWLDFTTTYFVHLANALYLDHAYIVASSLSFDWRDDCFKTFIFLKLYVIEMQRACCHRPATSAAFNAKVATLPQHKTSGNHSRRTLVTLQTACKTSAIELSIDLCWTRMHTSFWMTKHIVYTLHLHISIILIRKRLNRVNQARIYEWPRVKAGSFEIDVITQWKCFFLDLKKQFLFSHTGPVALWGHVQDEAITRKCISSIEPTARRCTSQSLGNSKNLLHWNLLFYESSVFHQEHVWISFANIGFNIIFLIVSIQNFSLEYLS